MFVVAGAFDVAAPRRIGVVGARFEFGLDGQRDVERKWGDGAEQQGGDGGVDTTAGHDRC